MRKIIVFNLISLDGYFKGDNEDISWHNVDDEFNDFAIEQTSSLGGLIFGATTYKMFEQYWLEVFKTGNWPDGNKASKEDQKIAQIINDVWKMVFSKSIKETPWKNSMLYRDIDPEEIKKWKAYDGKDMAIFGSGEIVKQFTELKLIDEYRFLVNPVVLGKGKTMFEGIKNPPKLKLISTKEFKNGNVLLTYSKV